MKNKSSLLFSFLRPFSFAACLLLAACAGAPRKAPIVPSPPPAESKKEVAPAPVDTVKEPAPESPALATTEPPAAAASTVDESAGEESRAGKKAKSIEAEAPSGLSLAEKRSVAAPERAVPAASGLQAGFADDNKQFNYFINFLAERAAGVPHFSIPVQERIVFKVSDSAGKPVPNARLAVFAGGRILAEGSTYADGTFLFFPSEHDPGILQYTAEASALGARLRTDVERGGKRQIDVKLPAARPAYTNVPLDILFVLDTTGSMGEEIERLKATIEIIDLNLSSLSSKPRVRFGLVLFRDRGDDYVTRVVALTEDLPAFRRELAAVSADGGGDDPEDLQAALSDAVKEISWDSRGIRLAFIVTDAPPHLDYRDQGYTYVDAVHEARKQGIKFYSVGTGGLDLAGELALRQISQYTAAKFIFLTYGEKGESGGGAPGSVSHHTGANFQTDKLESVIIRFAKEELSNLTEQPLGGEGDYIQATRVPAEQKGETLGKLFDMAIAQVIDYAGIGISAGTPTAALPVAAQAGASATDAEYFTEQLVLALARNRTFSAVERKDLQALMRELELQMSGLADETKAAKLGKLMGAKMLLGSAMFDRGEDYEVFLKLLRVETGEILSVTRMVVDKKLGLSSK